MSQQTQLESLRATLGHGPTDMLLWLASHGGWVGPRWLTPLRVNVRAEQIKKCRMKLEAAGLLRATYHRGCGFEYEIIRLEDLPIQRALEEWRQERAEVRRFQGNGGRMKTDRFGSLLFLGSGAVQGS